MKNKLMKVLMFLLPVLLAIIVPIASASEGFSGILNTYIQLISDKSKTVINTADLGKNILKGSLSGTDKYSYFQEITTYNSQINEYEDANFVGIGVTMTPEERGVAVTSVFMDSPAYRAGFKPGDIIVSVDGVNIAGKSLVAVAVLIKGPAKTSVVLSVVKNGVGEPVQVNIERDVVRLRTVIYTMYKDAAYIRITGFSNKTGDEFKKVLDKIDKAGIDSIIIDLRDNGGGTVRGCIDVARSLLSDDIIVKMAFRYNGYLDIRYAASENDRSYNTVVLVNENTASAAEILSAAIQDNDRGILVGENTFGKSLVQSSYKVLTEKAYEKYSVVTGESNMYVITRILGRKGIEPKENEWLGAVKLTIGEYLTPNGKSINNYGIAPNFLIEYDGPIAFEQQNDNEIFVYDKYDIGMASEEIRAAKSILQKLGLYKGDITGLYDEQTFDAVMKFQAAEGLYPYGVLDFTTQYALNNRLRLVDSKYDAQLVYAYQKLTEGDE